MNNHQRIGAISNSHVGSSFEQVAERYFLNNHFQISAKHSVTLGFQSTKVHYFDFGAIPVMNEFGV